jgi:nucleoside-diphosphate-sugar epimerase
MPAMDQTGFPARFADIEALDDYMSRPSAALVADLQAVEGDIMVIGVGGKMGPTVARLAKRAAPDKRVIGVARFSEHGLAARLESHGIETIAADLLDREAVAALPRAANVIFMAGRKFGSTGREDLTWAMNAHVPAMVAETFRDSRIIAYSTICVYSFVPVLHGGAAEDAALDPPGEYANSCIARERMFEYFSNLHGTPGMLIRLSYAIDMRYGVLYDIAQKVWTGAEIDVTMGHVNVIWQGDAASQSLRALRHATAPTTPINISGPEIASVRALAGAFAERFARPARIVGAEAPTAWVSDTGKAARLFGYPSVPLAQMIEWTADWVAREQPSLGKDTHFEVRSGTY